MISPSLNWQEEVGLYQKMDTRSLDIGSPGEVGTSCSLPDSPERHRYFGRLKTSQGLKPSSSSSLLVSQHRVRGAAARRSPLDMSEVEEATSPVKTAPAAFNISPRRGSDARTIIPVFDFSVRAEDYSSCSSSGSSYISPQLSYCTPSWLVLARCAVDVIDLSETTRQFMILLPDSVLYVSSNVELPAMLYCKLLIRSKRKGLPEPAADCLQGLSPTCAVKRDPRQQDIAEAASSPVSASTFSSEIYPMLDGPLFPLGNYASDRHSRRDVTRAAICGELPTAGKVGTSLENSCMEPGLDDGGVSSCGDDDDPTPRQFGRSYSSLCESSNVSAKTTELQQVLRDKQKKSATSIGAATRGGDERQLPIVNDASQSLRLPKSQAPSTCCSVM